MTEVLNKANSVLWIQLRQRQSMHVLNDMKQ